MTQSRWCDWGVHQELQGERWRAYTSFGHWTTQHILNINIIIYNTQKSLSLKQNRINISKEQTQSDFKSDDPRLGEIPKVLKDLLAPGGRLCITMFSPYANISGRNCPVGAHWRRIFDERQQSGYKWPGEETGWWFRGDLMWDLNNTKSWYNRTTIVEYKWGY